MKKKGLLGIAIGVILVISAIAVISLCNSHSSPVTPDNETISNNETQKEDIPSNSDSGSDAAASKKPSQNPSKKDNSLNSDSGSYSGSTLFYYNQDVPSDNDSDSNSNSSKQPTKEPPKQEVSSGDDSGSGTENNEEPIDPDDETNRLASSKEMGFEEAAPEFALFVSVENEEGSISQIQEFLKITDISRIDGSTEDYSEISYNLTEFDEGIYVVQPDYEDSFGDETDVYEAGHTYIAEVPENCGYILGATADPEEDDEIIWADGKINRINFNILADDTFDAKLDPSVKFIPYDEEMNITGDAFGSVITAYIEEDGSVSEELSEPVTGTFQYDGTLEVGDTVAIYKGDKPFEDGDDSIRITDKTDQLAYLTVTEVNENTYSYRTAELEEVLFVPDLLLIEKSWIVGDEAEADIISGEIEVKEELLVGKEFVPGDFVAIYDEDGTEEDVVYGLLTSELSVTETGVVITYEIISYDEMKNMYSMHYTVPVDMNLTDAEIEEIEQEIEKSLLANDGEILYSLINAGIEDYSSASGNRIKIKESPVPSVSIEKNSLSEFDNEYDGLTLSIRFIFKVEVDGKFDIWMELEYEQQYAVDYNIDGSVTCEKKLLGIPDPETLDENISVSIDTHSSYHFHLQVRGETAANNAYDEENLSDEQQNFVKEFDRTNGIIKELAKPFGLEYVRDYITGNLWENDETELSQMARAYAFFMERSNEEKWFTLPSIKLFQASNCVIYQLVQIRLRGELCGQVLLNGQSYAESDAKSAERCIYTTAVRKQLCKAKEVSPLMSPEVELGTYVFGQLGFRVGIQLTAELGMVHESVAKAAITVEDGLYAELQGDFGYYYHLKGNDREDVAYGFMYSELAVYE